MPEYLIQLASDRCCVKRRQACSSLRREANEAKTCRPGCRIHRGCHSSTKAACTPCNIMANFCNKPKKMEFWFRSSYELSCIGSCHSKRLSPLQRPGSIDLGFLWASNEHQDVDLGKPAAYHKRLNRKCGSTKKAMSAENTRWTKAGGCLTLRSARLLNHLSWGCSRASVPRYLDGRPDKR